MSTGNYVRNFVVNGKSYTEANFGEDKAKTIPFIVAIEEAVKEETVFGFTTEETMEIWLSENNLIENHQKLHETLRRAQRNLSSEEEDEVFRIQTPVVLDATKLFENTLKRSNIQPNEINKITDLLTNYDPLQDRLVLGLHLWKHCNYGGSYRLIPPGTPVPDFRWIFFGDTASSALHSGSAHILFEHSWFRGRRIYFYGVLRAECFSDYPWYFNDIASSAYGI